MNNYEYNIITPEYAELNRKLHQLKPNYGARGHRHIDLIVDLCKKFDCKTVLDYGCGKATMREEWSMNPGTQGIVLHSWDPCIPGLDTDPPACDLVFSSDVLEHVEQELVNNALDHLRMKTLKVAYLRISTRLDHSKRLPDGRNPHQSVYGAIWWQKQCRVRFNRIKQPRASNTHAYLLCEV